MIRLYGRIAPVSGTGWFGTGHRPVVSPWDRKFSFSKYSTSSTACFSLETVSAATSEPGRSMLSPAIKFCCSLGCGDWQALSNIIQANIASSNRVSLHIDDVRGRRCENNGTRYQHTKDQHQRPINVRVKPRCFSPLSDNQLLKQVCLTVILYKCVGSCRFPSLLSYAWKNH